MAAAPALSARLSRGWARLDGPGRLAGIDLARGLAVLGMLAAHLLTIEDFSAGDPTTWLDVVNGRSSILFATLAGVSIAVVTGGVRPVQGPARVRASARVALRAALLWVIGILLVATGVPVYVILPAYAVLFLLSLPFLGSRAPVLFAVAGVLALVMPWVQPFLDAAPVWSGLGGAEAEALVGWAYPFPVWIAFLLAGLGLGRCDLRRVRVQVAATVVGSALTVFGYGVASVTEDLRYGNLYLTEVWTAAAHTSGLWEVIGSGGFALAVIGACLLVCRTPLRWVVVPLRAVGSMPLTAYVLQLVVWAVVALALFGDTGDLRGIRETDFFVWLTAGLVAGCTAWALLLGRGPLEGLMDAVVRAVAGREPRPGVGRLGA